MNSFIRLVFAALIFALVGIVCSELGFKYIWGFLLGVALGLSKAIANFIYG